MNVVRALTEGSAAVHRIFKIIISLFYFVIRNGVFCMLHCENTCMALCSAISKGIEHS
jgi:hypothetical protein